MTQGMMEVVSTMVDWAGSRDRSPECRPGASVKLSNLSFPSLRNFPTPGRDNILTGEDGHGPSQWKWCIVLVFVGHLCGTLVFLGHLCLLDTGLRQRTCDSGTLVKM